MTLIKRALREENRLICPECGCAVYKCSECQGDYFHNGDVVFCDDESTKHLCASCEEERQ